MICRFGLPDSSGFILHTNMEGKMRKQISVTLLILLYGLVPFSHSAIPIELTLNEWKTSLLQFNDDDLFSFTAVKGEEYLIMVTSEDLDYLDMNILDTGGDPIFNLEQNYDQAMVRTGFLSEETGVHFIQIETFLSQVVYSICVKQIGDTASYAMTMMKEDKTRQALMEYKARLDTNPTDPELNFYVAVLNIVDIVETPDHEFSQLLDAFGAQIDFFPASEIVIDASASMEKISRIQEYAVQRLLPRVDETIRYLQTTGSAPDLQMLIPARIVGSAKERIEIVWFSADQADIKIVTGFVSIVKSMIYALSAFDLGIEPKVFNERFEDIMNPIDFDAFLIDYPDLFAGAYDIQSILQASLRHWLMGTKHIREGLEFMANRATPQSAHLFYTEAETARTMQRYLTLLDRTFYGLLRATGGDFNGDTRVDYWDLYDLRTLVR